jgi:cytochrome b561
MIEKAKLFLAEHGLYVIGGLIVVIGYLVYRMKKRNVKLFGR